MPFIPYKELTKQQKRQVKERRAGEKDNSPKRCLRLVGFNIPEETYKRFAFWVRPDGSVASYGMIKLPILEHRDGRRYVKERHIVVEASKAALMRARNQPTPLTPDDVSTIRRSTASTRALMRQYRISYRRLREIQAA